MPINIRATGNLFPQLAEMLPDLANLKPFKEVAEQGLNLAKKVDADLVPIMPRLGTVEEGIQAAKSSINIIESQKIPELDNVIKGVKSFTDEELLKLGSKYGILDEKVLAQAESLRYLDNGFTEVSGKVRTLEPIVDDTKKAVSTVVNAVEDNKGRLAKLGGDMLEVFGKVADILGLLATLGTAIRMEQIYNELKEVNDAQWLLINAFLGGLYEQQSINNNQQQDIDYLLDFIRNLNIMNETQFNALMGNINNVRDHVESNYSAINSAKGSIIEKSDEILREIDSLSIPTLDGIKGKVCEALNDCNPLLGIFDKIDEIKNILGDGNLFCGNTQFAQNISHGIEVLYCSGNSSSGTNDIADYFNEIGLDNDLQSIQDALEEIRKRVDSLYENQDEYASLAVLNIALSAHNANRLSFEIEAYLPTFVASVKSLGITFNDINGLSVSLSSWVGANLSNVAGIIPSGYSNRTIDDEWLESNNILSSGANLNENLNRNFDNLSICDAVLIDRLGLLLNALKDSGYVHLDKYPYQSSLVAETLFGLDLAMLDAINREGVYVPQAQSLTDASTGIKYIAKIPASYDVETQQIIEARDYLYSPVPEEKANKQIELEDALIDNEPPITLNNPTPWLND